MPLPVIPTPLPEMTIPKEGGTTPDSLEKVAVPDTQAKLVDGFIPDRPGGFIPDGALAPKEETENIFIPEKDYVLGLPKGRDLDEINMSVLTTIYHQPKESFWGGVNIAKEFSKGVYADILMKPLALGGLLKEQAARLEEPPKYEWTNPLTSPQDNIKKMTAYYANQLLGKPWSKAFGTAGDRLINASTNLMVKQKVQPGQGQGAQLAFGLGQGGMSVFSSIGIGYATRNPQLVGALFGLQQKGQKYVEMLGKGVPEKRASELSTLYAIPEGGFEYLGMDVFINTLRGSKVLPRILLRAVTEAAQEGSQQLSENVIDKYLAGYDMSWPDIAYQVGFAALIGGMVGAPAGVTSTFLEENSPFGQIRKDYNLTDPEVNQVVIKINEKVQKYAGEHIEKILDKEATEVELNIAELEKEGKGTEAEKAASDIFTGVLVEYKVKKLEELKTDLEENRQNMTEEEYQQYTNAINSELEILGQEADIRFSRVSPLGFFSKLEQAIEERMPASASADQVRGILASSGIKQEELEWIDIEGFLKEPSTPTEGGKGEMAGKEGIVAPKVEIFDLGPLRGIARNEGGVIGLNKRLGAEQNKEAARHELGHEVERQLVLRDNSEIIDEFGMEPDVKAKEMNRKENVAEAVNQILLGNKEIIAKHPKLVKLLEEKAGNLNDVIAKIDAEIDAQYSKLTPTEEGKGEMAGKEGKIEYLYRYHPKGDLDNVIRRGLEPYTQEQMIERAVRSGDADKWGWDEESRTFQEDPDRADLPRIFFTPEQWKVDKDRVQLRIKKSAIKHDLILDENLPPDVYMEGEDVGVPTEDIEIKVGKEWIPLNQYKSKLSPTEEGKVSKQDLLAYIRSNNVQVEEVVKGEMKINKDSPYALPEVLRAARDAGTDNPDDLLDTIANDGDAYRALVKKFPELAKDEDWQIKVVNDVFGSHTKTGVKFGNYQLPGGENYKELLLTIPTTESQKKGAKKYIEFDPDSAGGPTFDAMAEEMFGMLFHELNIAERADVWDAMRDKSKEALPVQTFMSPHFDEPNILAHVRFNERTDSEGKRVLFIEEIQSDWHQKGRKEGYAGETPSRLTDAEVERLNQLRYEGEQVRALSDAEQLEMLELEKKAGELEGGQYSVKPVPAVPNAPFKKTWYELALKRMLRYAVENGYQKLAWTTGDQQNERYDLSKQLSEVRFKKLDATKNGGPAYQIGFTTKTGDRHTDFGNVYTPEELPDVVGKDLAEKIIKSEKESGEFTGLDLKIGGEGMRGFYDLIIPSFLNKYTKKWGGRVGESQIVTLPGLVEHNPDAAYEKVHSLELTPSMKESVMGGQPLFSRGKGAGMTQEAVSAIVQKTVEKMKNLPDITVVQTIEEAQKILGFIPEDVRGAFNKNTLEVVLVADNIQDEHDTHFVIMHETVGHYGLQGIFTKEELTKLMGQIYKGNAEIKRRADKLIEREGMSKETATEEVIADMAHKSENITLLQRIYAVLRQALRNLNLNIKFTDADVAMILAESRRYVESPAPLEKETKPSIKERAADFARREEEGTQAREQLAILQAERRRLKGVLKRYPKGYMAEELAEIPSYYFSEHGNYIDEAISQINEFNAKNFEGTDELIKYLKGIAGRENRLKQTIADAIPERVTITKTERKVYREHFERIESLRRAREQGRESMQKTITGLQERLAAMKLMSQEQRDKLRAEMHQKLAELKQRLVWKIKLGQIKRADLEEYLRQNLPVDKRGRFTKMLSKVDSNTDMVKAFDRITEAIDQYRKEVITDRIKPLFEKAENSRIIAVEYKKIIADIAASLDEATPRQSTIKALQATKKFIESEIAAGRDPQIPKYVYESLGRLRAVPLASLTTADLANIYDRLQALFTVGRTKLAMRQAAYANLKEKQLAELIGGTTKWSSAEEKKRENFNNALIRAMNFARIAKLRTLPIDVLLDLLDGMQDYQGPNFKIFKKDTDIGFSNYLVKKHEIVEKIVNLAKSLGLDVTNFERIGIYAADQQEEGRKKLLSSGKTEDEITSLYPGEKNALSEKEMQLYTTMREMLDAMRPEIAEVMRIYYNEEFKEVENYFPFLTDWDAMTDAEIQNRFEDNVEQYGMKPRKETEKRFTKARVGGKQKIQLDAMKVFLQHMDNAIYLVSLGPTIKRLGEIAQSSEYGAAAGDIGQRVIREWIDIMARKGHAKGSGRLDVRVADVWRKWVGGATLGFRVSSALIQPTALLDGAAIIGEHAFIGATNVATSREWRQFLIKNFPELKERVADDPAFLDFGSDQTIDKINRAGFWVLKRLDLITASAITAGAYQKIVEGKGQKVDFAKPDKDAILEATRILRRTQASAFFKDVPLALSQGILDNPGLGKLVWQFQNFVLNRWSLIEHDLLRAGMNKGKVGQMINGFIFLTLAFFAETSIRRATKDWLDDLIEGMTGNRPDRKEREYWEDLTLNILGSIPFIGQVVSTATYGSTPVPTLEYANKLAEELNYMWTTTSDKKKVKHFIKLLSMTLPVRSTQIGDVAGEVIPEWMGI